MRHIDGVLTYEAEELAAMAISSPITTLASPYRTLLDCTGSHIAGRVAGTYGMAQGQPLVISGTGSLYALNSIYLASTDYPAPTGLSNKLRIRVTLYTNDVAPNGNFTFGLYPITRPATSGGAGLCIFTLGTVVPGSNSAFFTSPAADLIGVPAMRVSNDFNMPADGHYVLGVVTTATMPTSSHIHVSAQLQARFA